MINLIASGCSVVWSSQRTALLRDIPPLPTLNDPMISGLVYTDKSSVGRARSSFEDESDCPQDNEAYEHFGDAILSYLVTKLIRGSYPRMNPGGATVSRLHNPAKITDVS